MDTLTLTLVLAAAAIHAAWNTRLKQSGASPGTMIMMAIGWGIVGLISMPFVGLPPAASWKFLLLSTPVHVGYMLLLMASYRSGDMSVAYPIARGTGPVLVTAAAFLLLGEQPGIYGLAAVALIVAGVLMFGFTGPVRDHRTVLISLATGALIGAYSLIDGIGGRESGSPHSYSAALFLMTSISVTLVSIVLYRPDRAELISRHWAADIGAGMVAVCGYWIAIWAMSRAPLGLAVAVRESSVAFAALFGGLMLKERVRWVPVTLILAGVALARL